MKQRALLALLLVGCRDPEILEGVDPTSPTPPKEARGPIDHLAPGELLPGTEKAFGLTLPRGFEVRARFASSALAQGSAKAADLAKYVQARVKDGRASVEPDRASFDGVRVPEDPSRPLRIRIYERAPGFCEMQLNDETPPIDPGGDSATRLLRAGRTADGKLLGREKLE